MMDEIRRPLQRSVWLACSIAPSVTHSVLSGSLITCLIYRNAIRR